eukprot:2521662-Pyramimonas_sp.AAC.1
MRSKCRGRARTAHLWWGHCHLPGRSGSVQLVSWMHSQCQARGHRSQSSRSPPSWHARHSDSCV